MPEFFETELRNGTAQVAGSFEPPSAEAVRRHAELRTRRRRVGAAVLVLLVGGAAFGLTRPGFGHASTPLGPVVVTSGSPTTLSSTSPSPGRTPSSPPTGNMRLGVQLTAPASYAAATSNKVALSIDNPGPARNVLVEFLAPGTATPYWVSNCDTGVGGCPSGSSHGNPLKVAQGIKYAKGATDFDLALPAGTSSYNAWVDPPAGITSYSVLVLDGKTVLGQTAPEPVELGDTFPDLSTTSQDSKTLARGGPTVGFTTELDNRTAGSYVDLFSFITVSCEAGTTVVSVPQNAYTLEWYDGIGWANVGLPKLMGQFGYDPAAGQSTSTKFRISVSDAMPAGVTGCQVTQVVSASDTQTPPYYDQSSPKAQTVVDFTIKG